jgi:hypothetical protein
MLLVERLTGLADLLDHAVGLVLFDEPLDPGIVVAGDDQEAVATLEDPVVFVGAQLDRLETGYAVALAVEAHRRSDAVPFASFFDLLVDTTEHFLVPGGTLCEVHEVFYHPVGCPEPTRKLAAFAELPVAK